DALKAKIPPQILPGFGSFSDGSTNSDEKEKPASGPTPAAPEVSEAGSGPQTETDSSETSSDTADVDSDPLPANGG
ncbi:MAG: hypothetical protein ACPHF4_01735, partial [Rubripirellula sp.]